MEAAKVFFDNRERIDGVIRKYGVPDQDVEDVAHNVYEKIARALSRASASFRGAAQVGTWVYRIAANEALMYHRSNRRHLSRLDRMKSSEEHDVVDESAVDAGDAMDAAVGAAVIREALARVDDHARLVLRMFYFDGWSTAEIGLAFGVKETAGRTIVHRARAKLARVLVVA